MAELIEVLFYDRIGPYHRGTLHMIEDGVFLRALLKSKKGDVVNPPDWTPEKADARKAAELALVQKAAEPVPVKEPVAVKEEVKDGDTVSDKEVSVEVSAPEQPRIDSGYRKKSKQLAEESATDSSEGYGEADRVSESSEEDSAG